MSKTTLTLLAVNYSSTNLVTRTSALFLKTKIYSATSYNLITPFYTAVTVSFTNLTHLTNLRSRLYLL
jgi:hypothetical protein